MKKLKYLLLIVLFCLTGCIKSNSMDDIKIITSVYPIEYVVDYLYGEHSTISSIYPHDSNILDFKITEVLLEDYSNNDLFIFNDKSEEKNFVKTMKEYNSKIMVINSTEDIPYEYSPEELWLDPNNLLAIANRIKTGFEEYIDAKYLINQINKNYEELKIELTSLDGKFYSSVKNAKTNYIIITNDAFKFLDKYGLTVISLDSDTVTQKDITDAKELLKNGTCNYIFTNYKEELSDTVKDILKEYNKETLDFYTMMDLSELNIPKNNYITLMNDNLENLKIELYKS